MFPHRWSIFLVVGALATGCCRQVNWVYRAVDSDCVHFNSACLQYIPPSQLGGIEVQLLRTSCGTQTHLGVYCGTIPAWKGREKEAIVVLEIDKQRIPYVGVRFEGGQKVCLDEEVTQTLIEALLAERTVTLYMEGYQTTLCASNFCKQYGKFSGVPIATEEPHP